ncbi:MAG: NADH-quinone oxidoreductase subunit J [Pseudomonadota bacterium]
MIAGLINEAFFMGCALMVLGGGILAVSARSLIHAVTGLIVSLIGVAGLYFQLGSPFMFAMQILIYVGAVCIMMVFAIMLADPGGRERSFKGAGALLGLLAGLAPFIVLVNVLRNTNWIPAVQRAGDGSIEAIGKRLLLDYSLVFELISIVLLVAIMGAIVVAKGGRDAR